MYRVPEGLREILGGNGKLKRSGGVVITMIVVDNHKIEFERRICAGGGRPFPVVRSGKGA
jgi:hypothetical protein